MINDTSMLASSGLPLTKRGQSGTHAGCLASVTVLPTSNNPAPIADQPDAATPKVLFVAATKSTGEFVVRLSTLAAVERMALATLLRAAASHLEVEAMTVVCPQTVQDHVSNIRRAA